MDCGDFVIQLGSRLNIKYTDEQSEFIQDFNKPMISFSLPGTGKTATAGAGLITAEKYYKINPERIIAMSFTNNATNEIHTRHQAMCRNLGIKSKVQFNTLHKICSNILRKHSHLIGVPNYTRPANEAPFEATVGQIEYTCESLGIILKKSQARNILAALNYCNSSFIFDRENVESRFIFRKANIDYDAFMQIRSQGYEIARSTGRIPVGYIMLYALEILMTHPHVSEEFKKSCDLMLVDEFQDMTLLQLAIITKLCDKVIVIGDMNQQIYSFNGACQEIVGAYMKAFPDAVEHNLTQSFRCKEEIAKYAGGLIHRNRTHGEELKGISEGGIVKVTNKVTVDEVVNDIADAYDRNGRFDKTTYFLYRNNFSAFRIAEKLWSRRVPFYVEGHIRMNQQPIIRDLTAMIDLLRSPRNPDNLWILSKFIKEFNDCKTSEINPLYKPMQDLGCSFMAVDFSYENAAQVSELWEFFFDIQERVKAAEPVYGIYLDLYEVYYENYMKHWAHKMAINPSVIMEALEICCGNRDFQAFIFNEKEKAEEIEENLRRRRGIRCMTFHAGKGLEADIVHIFDAEKGIVPGDSKLREMHDLGCAHDVAREVRNERSLVYVACTRAREELYVYYRERLSPIFEDSNAYDRWDLTFMETPEDYDDAGTFMEFVNSKWVVQED